MNIETKGIIYILAYTLHVVQLFKKKGIGMSLGNTRYLISLKQILISQHFYEN